MIHNFIDRMQAVKYLDMSSNERLIMDFIINSLYDILYNYQQPNKAMLLSNKYPSWKNYKLGKKKELLIQIKGKVNSINNRAVLMEKNTLDCLSVIKRIEENI